MNLHLVSSLGWAGNTGGAIWSTVLAVSPVGYRSDEDALPVHRLRRGGSCCIHFDENIAYGQKHIIIVDETT